MKSFEIEDGKAYINSLFTEERFGSFYLHEFRARTALDYYVSGKLNQAYFEQPGETASEKEEKDPTYILWADIREKILSLIRGERLPLTMKLVLMFHRSNIERLCEMNNLPVAPSDVGGLFMNISFEEQRLVVTSGISLKVFTMDKTLERLWDDTIERYYLAS